MSSTLDRLRPSNIIDLTLSSDDESPPPVTRLTRAAHAARPPIPRQAKLRKRTRTVKTASTAQTPLSPFNHGLPSNDFFSRSSSSPQTGAMVGPWLNSQSSWQEGPFTRPSDENPAKRMRVGERPINLPRLHSPTQAAMPEVPLKILDRAALDARKHTQNTGNSARDVLDIVDSAALPRKPAALNSNRPHVPDALGSCDSNSDIQRSSVTDAPPRDTKPARSSSSSSSSGSSSSGLENLEVRKKKSPRHRIIKHFQKMHISPHVKTLLRDLGHELPDEIARRVRKTVVHKICDTATVDILLANRGSIPLKVEAQLANRARTMIKLEVEKFRNERTGAGVLGFQAEDHVLTPPDYSSALQAPVSNSIKRSSIIPREASSSSSDFDAVFDPPLQTDRPTPTTSPELSTDAEKRKGRYIDPTASTRAEDSTSLVLRDGRILPLTSSDGNHRSQQADVDAEQESSELSEIDFTSDDEDITADVRAFLKTLRLPNAPNCPIEARFGNASPPAAPRQNLLSENSLEREELEREERHYRLFGLDPEYSRPYLNAQSREDLSRGLEVANTPRSNLRLSSDEKHALRGAIFHIDFSDEEMAYIADVITVSLGLKAPIEGRTRTDLRAGVTRMMAGRAKNISKIVNDLGFNGNPPQLQLALRLIKLRDKSAVTAFLEDAVSGTISSTAKLTQCSVCQPKATIHASEAILNSLLRQRESSGKYRSFGLQREVKVELSNFVEDTIVPYRQWMDCSGDVDALAWNTEGTQFVCGAIAHSDSHNQQYNKPGNLMFGSIHSEVMRARPDHKIPRPVITKGENSFEAMRETQDPWLYSSVVCATYSPTNSAFFTSSFDKTVKVWAPGVDETQPELLGTWRHNGNVNFVVCSENHGLVATACDIVCDAIRVYKVHDEDVTGSSYNTYSGVKADEQVSEGDKTWAYFPATIAWAKCPLVAQLLLVGYSPRSTGIEESDIPEEKCNLGELCLWDIGRKERIDIWPRSQNVFEVVWHPTQPIFLAATAPHGVCEPWVRTQIRVFALNDKGGFTQTIALDCRAIDINEITVMPNSGISSYVTASCTDGKVYVWDTALGDEPIHVLEHGASIDDCHDIGLPNELSDNGVKFAAWGATARRFYTGSSDGLVKAWDVRAPRGQAFLRDVARLSGGVSSGAFSPSLTHLLIGDSTGKVHLLHIKDTETAEEPNKVLQKLVTPHPQPDEDSMWAGKGGEIGSELIRQGIIVMSTNKEVGAVQGPAYPALGWHYPAAHEGRDPRNPLLLEFARKQQINQTKTREHHNTRQLSLQRLPIVKESIIAKFAKRKSLDLDLTTLDEQTFSRLMDEGWLYEDEYNHDFDNYGEEVALGGQLVKKLRKGDDWEEEWVEVCEKDWIYLDAPAEE